jgi:hypothetical protein
MTIHHYEEHNWWGTLVMTFHISKLSPLPGMSSLIVDPLAVGQWLNDPTWHASVTFIMLGRMNLLLFDGWQSTRDNPNVPKIMNIVVASIAKKEGREILLQMHRLWHLRVKQLKKNWNSLRTAVGDNRFEQLLYGELVHYIRVDNSPKWHIPLSD